VGPSAGEAAARRGPVAPHRVSPLSTRNTGPRAAKKDLGILARSLGQIREQDQLKRVPAGRENEKTLANKGRVMQPPGK
jgi:hypothetical protein